MMCLSKENGRANLNNPSLGKKLRNAYHVLMKAGMDKIRTTSRINYITKKKKQRQSQQRLRRSISARERAILLIFVDEEVATRVE